MHRFIDLNFRAGHIDHFMIDYHMEEFDCAYRRNLDEETGTLDYRLLLADEEILKFACLLDGARGSYAPFTLTETYSSDDFFVVKSFLDSLEIPHAHSVSGEECTFQMVTSVPYYRLLHLRVEQYKEWETSQ